MKAYKWKVLRNLDKNNLTVDKVVSALLENRGIKSLSEREEFLSPKLEDVTLKKVEIDETEVEKTLKRIRAAIDKNEKIVIFGDYDVDGICGTAILWETLFTFYKNVFPHIPHRVDEGYGLSVKGIDSCLLEHPDTKLIITVDNGIVAGEPVEYAKEKGIDVVITDHHVRGDKAPTAYSIVHTTKLCGTGVAYLLSQEIIKSYESKVTNHQHLELVALATVADLVPLIGANRTLLRFGLQELKKTKRPGLLALFTDAAISASDVDVYRIGHVIAPRLNASGRIAHAMDSLRLICTHDRDRARKLAQQLSATNRDRQLITEEATLHANSISTQIKEEDKFIFVYHEDYNPGVIGLVASRLVERHYKPSIVVSVGEKFSKGSARSIAGFNIIEFIRTFNEYLVDAGGHPMAAGFTVATERVEEFGKALVEGAGKVLLDEHLVRTLSIDMEIPFSVINSELCKSLLELAPFGMANPEPVFSTKNVVVEDATAVGREKNHLKLALSQDNKRFEAILFGAEDVKLSIGDMVDLVYGVSEDTWRGNSKIQLKIRDFKAVSS